MDRGADFIDTFFKPELIARYLPDILAGMAVTVRLVSRLEHRLGG
jgi:hypothetical protein